MSNEAVYEARANLSEDEIQKLDAFHESLADITDAREREHLTDMDLCRYLRAREWDLGKAEKMCREFLAWRRELKVDEITAEEISQEIETGKIQLHGKDKHGRPILILRNYLQNTKSHDGQIKLIVYLLERAVESMDRSKGVEQFVLLVDFLHYSMFSAPPIKTSMATLSILMNNYPERLGCAVLLDAPAAFSILFKMVSPLMNERTKSKLKFASGKKEDKLKTLSEYIDADQLQEEYGGSDPWRFDHATQWAEEIERDKLRVAALQARIGSAAAASSSSSEQSSA